MSKLKWTTDKPTQVGWYWYRHDTIKSILVVGNVNGQIGVLASLLSDPATSRANVINISILQYPPGEWAGPLEAPQ